MIVGGLIGEAATIIFVPPGSFEKSLSVAFTLIIAAGVWIEEVGGEASEAKSEHEVAELSARAAEANERALTAQLELENFRKPWALPVKNLLDWEKTLSPFAGTPYRILTMRDSAPLLMASRLRQAFVWSRWTTLPSRGLPSPDEGIELISECDGVQIRVDNSRAGEWLEAAVALAGLFNAEGIEVDARVMESGTPADAIHIFIGRKI